MRSTILSWGGVRIHRRTLAAGLLATWFSVCGDLLAQGYGSPANDEKETASGSTAEDYYDRSTAGLPWLRDKGLMFFAEGDEVRGGRSPAVFDGSKYDTRRTLPYENGFCLTAKLQSDFSATNEDAKPANFSWTKDAGSDAFWEADAALRVDLWLADSLYNPDGLETSITFGAEVDKSLGEEEIDRRTYHLGLSMAALPLSSLPLLDTADQVVQIGVSYTEDLVSGIDRWNWSIDWEPAFYMGNLGVGMRCDFDGNVLDPGKKLDRAYYYIRPDVAVSYGEQTLLDMPIATVDDELVASYQLGVGVGLPFGTMRNSGGRIDLSYAVRGGVASGGEDFNYQEARLSFVPDNDGPTSFDISYLHGNDGFSAPDVDRFRIGFGIQF